MSEKLFNFVFVTTNLINGKQYVGDHSSNDLECWKTKHYLGSGKIIIKAVEKYKKENFSRKILEFFPTKQEAFDAQEKYIKQFNTLNINGGYNVSPSGGHGAKKCWSENSKEQMSRSMLGKNKGKVPWNKGMKMSKEFCEKTLKGIIETRTPLQKLKRSNTKKIKEIKQRKERKQYTITKIRKPFSDEHKKAISESCMGRKQSEETKQKIGIGHLGKKYIKHK
jgi:hypothetical protein